MNETKGYKNINLSDLGTRQKITQVASKVALFVPRLLGKLATKLVINPITKLATGQTYEQVRNAAVDITMAVQEEQAAALDERIEEGHKNLVAWQEDTDYYISNLGKYKSYQSTIEDLEKKRTRLLSSPKRLLVAKHYRYAMSKFIAKHKEEKANEKLIQKVVSEYKRKQEEIVQKELEVEALRQALKESEASLQQLRKETKDFETENASILNQPVVSEDYVEIAADETVVTPEEVSVEPQVDVPTTEEPSVEQPANQPEEKVTFRALDPNVNYSNAEEPVYRPVTKEEAEAFRRVGYPAVAEEATSEEQTLFNQMANMAAMGQVPPTDTSVLEAYGLSQEGTQKTL